MIFDITIWDILNYWGVKPIDFIIIGFTVIFIFVLIIGLVKVRRRCANKKNSVNDEEPRRIIYFEESSYPQMA